MRRPSPSSAAPTRRSWGTSRPFEYFEQVYLTGTPSEIVEKLRARMAIGIEYLILHTLEPSAAQLDLWAEHVLPHLAA